MKPNLLKNPDGTPKHDWNDPSLNWLEDHLQQAIIQHLFKRVKGGLNIAYAASLEGMRVTGGVAAKAKASGMVEGEPDLRLYGEGGFLVLVEVKRKKKGRISSAQTERHKRLKELGFTITTLWALCPNEAICKIDAIIAEHFGL